MYVDFSNYLHETYRRLCIRISIITGFNVFINITRLKLVLMYLDTNDYLPETGFNVTGYH